MSEWTILRQLAWREIYSRRKVFAITTVFLAIVVSAAMFVLLREVESADQFTILHSIDLPRGFETTLTGMLNEGTELTFVRHPDTDSVRRALEEDEAEAGIIGPLEALWGSEAPFDLKNPIIGALTASNLQRTADDLGLSPDDLTGLLATARGEDVGAEVNTEDEVVAVFTVILLFMAIITYGQWVSYGVVEEKGNRIIELILATSNPIQILWAKILSIGALGLAQLVLIISISLGLGLAWEEIPLPEVAASTGAWMVLWFILGFGFYAALFASAGALASNSQEASNSVGPMAIVPGVGYMVAIPMMNQATPNLALQIMAFFPPWSPLLVPAMLARGWMSPLIAGVAALVVAATVWLVVRLAARIYAGGVTQSTKTVGWREAFRSGSDLLQ